MSRPFTGRDMALVMAGFFGVTIAANAALAVFATRSHPGLIVRNGYVESQRFDAVTATRRAERALGRRLHAQAGGGTLTLSLGEADGRPVTGTLSARIGRPGTDRFDIAPRFEPRRGGLWVAQADLAPGPWIAEVALREPDGRLWHDSLRFTVERAR